MADCTKTEVFLREWKRMCKHQTGCSTCKLPLFGVNNLFQCQYYFKYYPKEAIEIVQKWSDENPKKTRQSEFLEHYPNAKVDDGVLDICPLCVDGNFHFNGCNVFECADCERMYWLAKVE